MIKCTVCDDISYGEFCTNKSCIEWVDSFIPVTDTICVPPENVVEWDESFHGLFDRQDSSHYYIWKSLIDDSWTKVLNGHTMWLNIGGGYFVQSKPEKPHKPGWVHRSNTGIHSDADTNFCKRFRPVYAKYCRWGLPNMPGGGVGIFMLDRDAVKIDKETNK